MTFTDREAWLTGAYQALASIFETAGYPVADVDKIKISTGFGLARGENASILGQTINPTVSANDTTWTIFVSPLLSDGREALIVLAHEMVHVAVGTEEGHGKVYAHAGEAVGLEGKPTTMAPGAALEAELLLLAEELGEYPHVALDLSKVHTRVPVGPDGTPAPGPRVRVTTGPAVQTNRHMKCVCMNEHCDARGYLVRTSARWLAVATPRCPVCNTQMHVS